MILHIRRCLRPSIARWTSVEVFSWLGTLFSLCAGRSHLTRPVDRLMLLAEADPLSRFTPLCHG
jgi:hypothetical protein